MPATLAVDKSTIVSDILTALETYTGFNNLTVGGKARALLECMGDVLSKQVDRIKTAQVVNLVSQAKGEYLTALGEILGVPVYGKSSASADATSKVIQLSTSTGGSFGSINGGQDIVIPEGTEIYSSEDENKNVIFTATEQKTLDKDDTADYISARAKISGTTGNVSVGELDSISFTDYTDYKNGSLVIKNLVPIVNGKETETEDNYRYRLVNQAQANAKANATTIRLACLTVPGVANVYIRRFRRGIGTADIVIQATSPTVPDSLIQEVKLALLDAVGVGNQVEVVKPKETGIGIELTIKYAKNTSLKQVVTIESDIAKAIGSYIDGLALGNGVYVNELVQVVMDTSELIKDIGVANYPIDALYTYSESTTEDTRRRTRIDWNYVASSYEKVFLETTVDDAVVLRRIWSKES